MNVLASQASSSAIANHDRVVDWVELHVQLLFPRGRSKSRTSLCIGNNLLQYGRENETTSQDVSFYLYRSDWLCNFCHSSLVKE